MRSREAWLAAMAAVLGVSDVACKKDATDAPATVREVASASASASASAPVEVASAPVPETSASAIASASASAKPKPVDTGIGIGSIGGHDNLRLSCGARAACGASVNPGRIAPAPTLTLQVPGGNAEDVRTAQT